VGDRLDLRVRNGVQFLPHVRRMDARLPDGRRAVAGGVQRLHQAQRDASISRVLGSESPQPFRGTVRLARDGRVRRQQFQRGTVRPPVALARAIQPQSELGRVRQEEPVEERSRVHRGGTFGLARRQPVGEL
jgi:hypothetical protein